MLSVAIGVAITDTSTAFEVYSHPAAVVILTVTASPSFNTPAAGDQF